MLFSSIVICTKKCYNIIVMIMIAKDTLITKQRRIKSKFLKNYGVKYKFYPRGYKKICDTLDTWIDVNYMSMHEDGRMNISIPKEYEGKLPVVVWIHGGGYTGGDKIRSSIFCRTLASYGFMVINMNYHLAPEAKYPTPIIQFYEMLNYLNGHLDDYPMDLTNVFIGGDSAGAQLASQIGAIETNSVLAQSMGINQRLGENLRGLLLCCGLYNMDNIVETKFPLIDLFLYWYTGHKNFLEFPHIDEMSTTKNVTEAYPDVFITCGNRDYFYSQATEFCSVLDEKNVKYDFISTKGKHESQYHLRFKEARATLDLMVEFIKKSIKK